MSDNQNQKRGFAALSPERRHELCSKGGKAAHARGLAHEFNTAEAKAAGAKGGTKVSQNREYMREIGRRGGFARNAKRNAVTPTVAQESVPDSVAVV